MLMKFRGRFTEGRRRPGERPSSAASAAERLRWRVFTDATDRNDGDTFRLLGALIGSTIESAALAPVSGGVGGVESVGEKAK